MITLKQILASTVAASLALSLGACASTTGVGPGGAGEWKNVPWSQYYKMGQTVTPEAIQFQELGTRNHCMLVSFETLPSKERLIIGRGLVQATNASLGEVLGLMAEYSILGVKLAGKTALAGAGFQFLGNIFFGAQNGDTEANQLFRSNTDACMARQAGGLYTMSPSEQNYVSQHNIKIVAGGQVWGSDKITKLTGGPIPPSQPQIASPTPGRQTYAPPPQQYTPASAPQKGKCGAACDFTPHYYGSKFWPVVPSQQQVAPGALVQP